MKKNYIAPLSEDVILEGLMAEATFLGVNQPSAQTEVIGD